MVLTALHDAAAQGQVESVRTLSSLHPSWLTERDAHLASTPLHLAAEAGQCECVRALLEAGAPKEACTAGGCTALSLASMGGHVDCVRALLAAGADIIAADVLWDSPMHVAARSGYDATLCALLEGAREAGLLPAALQARNFIGHTPLHEAALHGSTACMAALLACGSDISALTAAVPSLIGGGAATALHLAAEEGGIQAVQLIASLAPALATVRAADGSTPLDVARFRHRLEVARCLERSVPTAAALSVLAGAGPPALPLFPQLLASRWPLAVEEWELVPAACPGLGTLLPRAVQESGTHAAQVVRHLPHADRQRLQASALSLALGRDRRHEPLPQLPPEIAHRILALSLA